MQVCPQTDVEVIEAQKDILIRKLDINGELLKECQRNIDYTEGTLEEVHRENAFRHIDCVIRHDGLVKTINIIKGDLVKD